MPGDMKYSKTMVTALVAGLDGPFLAYGGTAASLIDAGVAIKCTRYKSTERGKCLMELTDEGRRVAIRFKERGSVT